MGIRRTRRAGRRLAVRFCRAVAMLAIAAKLLVPVGYMPASLADGGPIVLCDSGLSAAFAGLRADRASGPAADPPNAVIGHHGGAGHMEPDSEASGSDGHAHDSDAADHLAWERCSLGALASLVAISAEWRFSIDVGKPLLPTTSDQGQVTARAFSAYRSRAPPFALS